MITEGILALQMFKHLQGVWIDYLTQDLLFFEFLFTLQNGPWFLTRLFVKICSPYHLEMKTVARFLSRKMHLSNSEVYTNLIRLECEFHFTINKILQWAFLHQYKTTFFPFISFHLLHFSFAIHDESSQIFFKSCYSNLHPVGRDCECCYVQWLFHPFQGCPLPQFW